MIEKLLADTKFVLKMICKIDDIPVTDEQIINYANSISNSINNYYETLITEAKFDIITDNKHKNSIFD